MCDRNRLKQAAFVGVVLVGSLIAVGASAQTQPGGTSTPALAANPSSPIIHYHYHFHQHNYAPMSSPMYPSAYANPTTLGAMGMSSPMWPGTMAPTQAQPYPQGYLPGPFAPMGFQNMAPGAPPAQGVIHVFLPTSDAVVCLNGQQIRGKGKDRKLTTPVLPSNREFQYWVTATFPQNGESVTQYRKAIVGAGEYTVADFTRPPEENLVRLPAGPVDPSSVVPPAPE